MARVLISEPVAEIRTLLQLLVSLLGHEPELLDDLADVDDDVDVAFIEPSGEGLELAAALRRSRPALPIVFVSTKPPSRETRALSPVRHIIKPFERIELLRAIDAAVGQSPRTP